LENFDIEINPAKRNINYWRDVWKFRELFYFFAWRDLLVRYKQTLIGVAWSVLRPLLTMIVFTGVFGKLAKLPDNGVPYLLLVGAAMLPWQFFANAFTDASNSLVANSNMITKVYFPRIIIPVSTVIVSVVDFFISLSIIVVLMLFYQFAPGLKIISIFFFLSLAFVISLGAGLFIAALNAKYRDFKFVIPFIVQFGLFISPVGFSSTIIPEKWRMLYSLNPMVGVIDGFRWAILGGQNTIYLPALISSITISVVLLVLGVIYFRRTERKFADFI
jgi:lipopolysaccharide transport system permease protein